MNTRLMFSSASDEWTTPVDVFRTLDAEFNFNLDPCPTGGTDGLTRQWSGHRVFCNPPYSNIRAFIERATEADVAVFLVPSRTDTRWFHECVIPFAREIRFIRGRLKFGAAKNSAPFPSMIVVFKKEVSRG
jgi:phage N-6-adenine-methyltransferase